jgi:hypothetical protein
MSRKADPSAASVQSSFQELAAAATRLNKVSDQLGKAVASLDAALAKLNLGVTTWVAYDKWSDEEGRSYGLTRVGYAKIGSKWGIAIRSVEGDAFHGDEEHAEWLFNDAARDLRLRAIEHIPDLIQELIEQVNATSSQVSEKVKVAEDLAVAISGIAENTGEKQ